MKIKTVGYTVLALAILVSSSIPLAYKLGSNINAISLTFWASLAATISSLVVMLAKGGHKHLFDHFGNRRSILAVVFVGTSFAVQTLIFGYTTHYISASLLAVIYRSWPLIFMLIVPFALKEKTSKYDMAAVIIGFSGMAIVLLGGTAASLPPSLLPFAGMVLFAAVLDAVTGIFQKGYKYEMTSTLFLYSIFFFLASSLFAIYSGTQISVNIGMDDIYVILFIGIVQSVALTFLFTTTLRMNKPSVMANAVMATPFITMALDYVFIGEPLQAYSFLIALSVLIGLLIQKFAPKASNYLTRSKYNTAPVIYDITSVFIGTKNVQLSNAIKGNGRALAICTELKNVQELKKYLYAINEFDEGDCIITSNKTDSLNLQQSEYEYMKEIVGHKDDDVLIMGFGNPDLVESRLIELYTKIAASD